MPAGRPSALTATTQQKILDAIMNGATREAAAAAAGVGRSTYQAWLQKGHASASGKYRDFVDEVEKAEEAFIAECTKIIYAAAPKTWQAAAWLLERKWPDQFGRRDRLSIDQLMDREVEKLALQYGLAKEDILAEAQRILTGSR